MEVSADGRWVGLCCLLQARRGLEHERSTWQEREDEAEQLQAIKAEHRAQVRCGPAFLDLLLPLPVPA